MGQVERKWMEMEIWPSGPNGVGHRKHFSVWWKSGPCSDSVINLQNAIESFVGAFIAF